MRKPVRSRRRRPVRVGRRGGTCVSPVVSPARRMEARCVGLAMTLAEAMAWLKYRLAYESIAECYCLHGSGCAIALRYRFHRSTAFHSRPAPRLDAPTLAAMRPRDPWRDQCL